MIRLQAAFSSAQRAFMERAGWTDRSAFPRPRPLHRAGKDIAFASHRLEKLRRVRVRRKLAAKAADRRINTAIEAVPIVLSGKIGDGISAEDPVRSVGKRRDEIEFGRCEFDPSAVYCGQLTARWRQDEHVEAPLPFRPIVRLAHVVATCPPHDRSYPRKKLPQLKRLTEIIIGPYFQANDPVDH